MMRALDPLVRIEGADVVLDAVEADRTKKGLAAVVRASATGAAPFARRRLVQLAAPEDVAAFADEVAATLNVPAAHVADRLDALTDAIESALRQRPAPATAEPAPYVERAGGMWWEPPGRAPLPLANFTARLVGDVRLDDGSEGPPARALELAVERGGRRTALTVPAEQFRGLAWVLPQLGAGAVVYPGAAREHLPVAIQTLSGAVPERVVYAHTGWRRHGDTWLYLHAGGALGADGVVPDVEVQLPAALSRYQLPAPPADGGAALRASLDLVTLGPVAVLVPLVAAVYRAAVCEAPFALHLAGSTGVFKSQLAALVQQHWGAALDAEHLPANWDSTANAITLLCFTAKDSLLVVDDFVPSGSAHDVGRQHREAQRLLRAQGNQSSRHRMTSDARLHAYKPPRGLLLSTGEDVPMGGSLRARLLVLDVAGGAIAAERLTLAQRQAAAGTFAAALATFVAWLAPRRDAVLAGRAAALEALRERARDCGTHRRAPAIVAELGWGLDLALDCATAVGGLGADDVRQRRLAAWAALVAATGTQGAWQTADEPARRFFELLASGLGAGRVHVAAPDGGTPPTPGAWGWRETPAGNDVTWRPQGDRVGWLEGGDAYLEPSSALAAARRLAADGGEPLAISQVALHKRLAERGLLVTTARASGAADTLTVRKTLQGQVRRVLHVARATLTGGAPEKPDKTTPGGQESTAAADEETVAAAGTYDDVVRNARFDTPMSDTPGELAKNRWNL